MPMSSGPSSSGLNSFAALNGGKVTFAKKTPVVKPPKVKKEPVVDDWEAAETAEEEKEKVVLDGSSGEEDPTAAAAVKIVPVVEGDTGKVVKLEEEPIVESGEQSGVQSDAELAVPEPKVDGESDSVE
jgi:hypothetical protein